MIHNLTGDMPGAGMEAIIIGEIDPLLSCTELEHMIMHPAVIAHCATRTSHNLHPARCPKAEVDVFNLGAVAGDAVERMIISRFGRTVFDQNALFAVARTDYVIEHASFGITSSYYSFDEIDLPRDVLRPTLDCRFVRGSHLRRVLVSQDIGAEAQLTRYSGYRCNCPVSIG